MRNIIYFVVCSFVFISCRYDNPAFRFSNFYGTKAEKIAKAIAENDKETIREEVLKTQVNINFKDNNHEVSLLTLAITNNRKEAFEELLRLGADTNIDNSYCVSPLISAIRYNYDCDMFFINGLLDNGAEINPMFFKKCNYFASEPIVETINQYVDEEQIECGLKILKVLISKLNNQELLLSMHNNSKDYRANIIYSCLSTHKNLNALKYLIVDLGYKVPKEIFIDETILLNYKGYKSLKEILQNSEFNLEKSEYKRKAKDEILDYLNR